MNATSRLPVLIFIACIIVVSPTARAQSSFTWTGGGTDGNWMTGGNWGGTAPSAPQAILNFAGSARLANTNNFSAGNGFQVVFKSGAGSFTLWGNALTFYDWAGAAPRIGNDGTAAQTVNFPFNLGNNGGGGLQINAAAGNLTFGGPINLNANTLNVSNNSGFTTTFGSGAVISGTGKIIKTGVGTVVLAGNNNYSGGTMLNAGTLAVSADANLGASASGLTNSGSSTLHTTATFGTSRSVAFTGPTTIQVDSGTTLYLTNGFVNTAAANAATMNVSGGGTFSLKGNVVVSSDNPWNINNATVEIDPGTGGTFNVTNKFGIASASSSTAALNLRSGTANIGAPDFFVLGDNSATASGTVNVSGGTLNLYLGSGQRAMIGLAGTGVMNISGGTVNVGPVVGNVEIGGDISYSGNNASGTLTLSGTGAMNVPANGTYALELGRNSTGKTGANGRLNLYGGTLTTGRGVASGGGTATMYFSGGTLKASAASTTFLTGLTSAYVSTNGAIIDDGGQAITIGQPLLHDPAVSGTDGGLLKLGGGTLTLAGANTYNGTTVVNAGTLAISGDGNLGATASSVTLGNGTLRATATMATSRSITLINASTLSASGTSTILALNNGFTSVTPAGINLNLSGGGTLSVKGNVAINNDSALYVNNVTLDIDPGATGTFNATNKIVLGNVSSSVATMNVRSGTVNLAAPDFLVLADATASASGTLNVLGGTMNVSLGSGQRILIGSAGAANINVSGGTLNIGPAIANVQLGGDIQFSANNASGTMTLSSTGVVNVAGSGVFELGRNSSGKSGATGRLNLYGGTLTTSRDIAKANGAGTLYFSGGTLKAGAASATFLNGLTAAYVSTNGAIIDDGGYAIVIGQALGADPGLAVTDGGLLKSGSGSVSLAGANTYGGGTVVSGGTLLVNGSIASSSVTVSTNATLGGSGTIGGVVTVQQGGTLSPGSIATLTLSNAPVLQGTTLMQIDNSAAGTNSAQISLLSGTFNYGGRLVVTNVGPSLTGGEKFTLFNAGAFNGFFDSVALPALASQTPALNWYAGNLPLDGSIKVNRAPAATNTTYSRGPQMSLKINVATHLNACTSDADGDTVSLQSIGATTGGGTAWREGEYIFYLPPENDGADSFTYTVADAFGGTATAAINIAVVKQGGQAQAITPGDGSIGLTFAGIPGVQYDIQRDTDPYFSAPTVICTTNAPATGVFNYTDPYPPQPSAFYRLTQH